jgi:hypothetical protein
MNLNLKQCNIRLAIQQTISSQIFPFLEIIPFEDDMGATIIRMIDASFTGTQPRLPEELWQTAKSDVRSPRKTNVNAG